MSLSYFLDKTTETRVMFSRIYCVSYSVLLNLFSFFISFLAPWFCPCCDFNIIHCAHSVNTFFKIFFAAQIFGEISQAERLFLFGSGLFFFLAGSGWVRRSALNGGILKNKGAEDCHGRADRGGAGRAWRLPGV